MPPLTLVSMQPWWVQTLENALKLPELGWVTTKSLPIVPLPSGTSLLATVCAASAVGPDDEGAFDGLALADDELEALSVSLGAALLAALVGAAAEVAGAEVAGAAEFEARARTSRQRG